MKEMVVKEGDCVKRNEVIMSLDVIKEEEE